MLLIYSLDFYVVLLFEFVDFLNDCWLEFSSNVLSDLFDIFQQSFLTILIKKLSKALRRQSFQTLVGEEIQRISEGVSLKFNLEQALSRVFDC